VASLHTVTLSLSVEETRTLLQKVPKAYHTQINDVLLTALVQALADWTGQRSVMIDLEGHGREMIFEDVDVSRTLGWFTTIFPVRLDLGSASNVGDVLKSIKEQLRRIPNRGIGYGLLRYLSSDEQIVRRLKDAPQPEVSFNYLGQFGQSHESSGSEAAEEPTGPNLSPRGQRRYLLEIDGGIYEGRLQIDWAYCKDIHARSTIERLVENYGARLRTIIAHCSAPGVGGYTPSDFSAARVSQEDLEKLLERLG
jgi:non-ribosomal peptide synthase protein (TIGR01720 family)